MGEILSVRPSPKYSKTGAGWFHTVPFHLINPIPFRAFLSRAMPRGNAGCQADLSNEFSESVSVQGSGTSLLNKQIRFYYIRATTDDGKLGLPAANFN